MGLRVLVAVISLIFSSTVNSQELNSQALALDSSLVSLFSSFLSDTVVISAFAPVATNPALLSSLESYIEYISTGTLIPTSYPAFATALPTEAQSVLSSVFAKESSIIAANGGASALSEINNPFATSTTRVSNTTSSTAVIASQASITPATVTGTTTNIATSVTEMASVASATGSVSSVSSVRSYTHKSWYIATLCAVISFLAVVTIW